MHIITSGTGDWRFLDLVPKQAGKLEVRGVHRQLKFGWWSVCKKGRVNSVSGGKWPGCWQCLHVMEEHAGKVAASGCRDVRVHAAFCVLVATAVCSFPRTPCPHMHAPEYLRV